MHPKDPQSGFPHAAVQWGLGQVGKSRIEFPLTLPNLVQVNLFVILNNGLSKCSPPNKWFIKTAKTILLFLITRKEYRSGFFYLERSKGVYAIQTSAAKSMLCLLLHGITADSD